MSNPPPNRNISLTANPYKTQIPFSTNVEDYFSEDPDELTSEMRNASTNRALEIYNTFARINHERRVNELQPMHLLEERGLDLGNKFAQYLLFLRQSNNKHYSVGTKVGYF